MWPVQEMNVEFVNALNAAESECAKLRRMLEEEQKLVQRLEQEKEDEMQMANRKIERMSLQLAEARKHVEFATNEWIKVKRELHEAQVLVQLLKLKNEKTRQSTLKQVEVKEIELANALNAAAIAERELQKERELLQWLKMEYDEIRRSAKRQVEEKELELANLLNASEIAEIEWIKVKKELQEKLEHVQLLKQECQETRQNAMRQVEEKELEFADALNAAAVTASSTAAAEGESAKLKRMLIEEGKTVRRLILEKDLVLTKKPKKKKDLAAKLAQRQVEETRQELANVLNVTTTTESSSTAEGFAATSVFANFTHSQSTPFGSSASSPSFGSSGNTTISSGSSMLPSSSVVDVFNSSSNTCSSHSSAMSRILRFSNRENKSYSRFPFGVSGGFVSSASSSPILVSSTASTVSSPIPVSTSASAATNASSPKFGSTTSSVASTASASKSSFSPASIASCTSMPIIGSSSPSSSSNVGGRFLSGRKFVRVRKVESGK